MSESSIPSRESCLLLDNPIWNSLTTRHAHLAIGTEAGQGLARRYPPQIGPLSALQEPTPEAYADLALLVPEGDVAVLFLEGAPVPPDGWELVHGGRLVQMACARFPDPPSIAEAIIPMGQADYADMVELATLTEPGPFRSNTADLGGFLGIRVDSRLAAMAGQRLAPTGFAEVSAVCAHPDFRGRGYARALVAAVARNICNEGRVPFLTSYEANTGAISVYQKVCFAIRRTFELAVLKPPKKVG